MTVARPSPTPILSPQACAAALMNGRARYLRFLQRMLGDRAASECIFEETLRSSMRQLDSARSVDVLSTWFHAQLRQAAMDHLQRVGASRRAVARAQLEAETFRMVDTSASTPG